MAKKQQNKNPRWDDDLLDSGFTAIPNALLDHQGELGITNSELLLILKVSRNSPEWRIHDKDFPGNQSYRTLQRTRKSLRDKGYLDFTTVKHVNNTSDSKKYYTAGIVYNLDGLSDKLRSIHNTSLVAQKEAHGGTKIADERQILSPQVTKIADERQILSRGKHRMSTQPYTNVPYTNVPYTNVPYTIIITRDNNNENMEIKLAKEQYFFLEEYKKIYNETYGKNFEPQMKDIRALQRQNLKELLRTAYLLPYWFPYKEDAFQQNEWLKKSDGSIPVLFKPDINHKFRSEFIPMLWHKRHTDKIIKELFSDHMKSYNKFKRRAS